MDNENCEPCYGISCPHWPTCFPGMQSDIKELEDKNTKLQAENKRLKEQNRWIPVSERLPKEIESDEILFIAQGLIEAGEFKNGLFWNNNGRDFENITHWKPIILPAQALQETSNE